MRKPAPLHAALVAVATAAAATGLAASGASAAQAAATPLPAHVFAPYFESYNGDNPVTLSQESGAKYLTFAFIQTASSGSCTAYWDGDTSERTETAGADLYSQLQSLYPSDSSAQLWNMIGVTEMPGIDDFGSDETFTQADATTVLNWARSNGVTGAQTWIPQSNGSLVNPNSGKCLDDTGFGGSGTQVQIWSCTGGTNQKWILP